jgi:D-amino-acid dehydrogenase
MTTAIIGAGVAGLSVAFHLLRRGRTVLLLDPHRPGEGGASWGNSGIVSAALVTPLTQPGVLRQLPRWLLDPLGPVAIRPSYLPTALPWIAKWMRAGGEDKAERVSDAIQALHRDAFGIWREMIGEESFGALVRQTGQVVGFETPAVPGGGALEARLRARHGIAAEPLDRAALERIYPGIAPSVLRGLLLPGQGHMLDPGRLTRRLAERLGAEGASFMRDRVRRLRPDAGGWRVECAGGDHAAQEVVVAAGAWSGELLAPLGVRLPLIAERGYHAELPPMPLADMPIPISFRSRGLALTPMAHALRASGTVEIAAPDAAPAMRRADHLAAQARALFPAIPAGKQTRWMGPRPSLPDGLPAVGAAGPRGLHLCCGHGHFGMTSAPGTARLLAALMDGAPPPVDPTPYRPARFD